MEVRTLGLIARFAVISDVHLKRPDDSLTALFIQSLETLADEGVEAVILLGDVFDFIFVAHSYFYRMWAPVFEACARLGARGIKVIFLEGNHDFGFEHGTYAHVRQAFFLAGDCEVTLLHPVLGLVSLRHGDDVVCPPSYRSFRTLVKNFWFQRLCKIIPGAVMQKVFSRYAKLSRSRDTYRVLEPAYLQKCTAEHFEHFRGQRPAVFVIGHIHTHVDARIGGVRLLAGNDWLTHPNILRCFEDGLVVRTFLRDTPPE